MKINKSALALALFTIIIFGCSTYKAPSLPENQLAHIKELDTEEAIIIVHKIDGVITKAGANEYGLGMLTAPHKKESYMRSGTHIYDVSPGFRELSVLFQKGVLEMKHTVAFNAKAGTTYQLKYSSAQGDIIVFVEEM